MKAIYILIASLCITGCSSIAQRTLRITQEFEGTGSISLVTRTGSAVANVENARQEDGDFKADKIDLVATNLITGAKLEVHLKPYSRPIIEPANPE